MHPKLIRFVVGAAAALSLLGAANFAQASSLTQTQISAIIGLLRSFGADQNTINNVSAALNGQATGGSGQSQGQPGAGNSCFGFSHNLYVGVTDATTGGEVSQLQTMLGVSPTGYFGPLTKQAVINWQGAHGISPIGVVGPATRAALACGGSTSSMNSSNFTAMPTTGPAPLLVTFMEAYPASQMGSIDFGDGSVSDSSTWQSHASDRIGCASDVYCSTVHTYTNAGTYHAVLKDSSGKVLASQTITVTGSSTSGTPSATIDQSSLSVANGTPTLTGTISGTSQISVSIWQGTLSPQQLQSPTSLDQKLELWGNSTLTRVPEVSVNSAGRWTTSIGGSQVAGGGAPSPYFAPGTYTVAVYDMSESGSGTGLLASGVLTVTGGSVPSIVITSISGKNVTVSYNAAGNVGNAYIELVDQSNGLPVDSQPLSELHAPSGSGSVTYTISTNITSGTYFLELNEVSHPWPKSSNFTLQ